MKIDNLAEALAARALPTVVMWNRLEGRPRAANFDRALKAEVRDALWMLTRQWQIGEFEGEDAGSPVGAKIHVDTTLLDHYATAASSEALDDTTPLQSHVERQRIALVRGGRKIQLDLRLQLGRQWGKLLASAGLGSYAAAYRAKYPFALPPQDRTAADVYAHVDAWQTMAAVAGRAIDGGELYLHLGAAPANAASDGIQLTSPAHKSVLDGLGASLLAWFDGLYSQPASEGAWQPANLDYSFSCSAPDGSARKTLVADQFQGGDLDWWTFDVADERPPHLVLGKASSPRALSINRPGPVVAGPVVAGPIVAGPIVLRPSGITRSFLPSPLTFAGAPNARWWKFEDSKVSFGDVKPSTTDLGKLLLVEFALVYGNDWFLLPLTLPAGSLANVRGLTVTNTFGERFWIEAAGAGKENAWQSWRMFGLSARGAAQADQTLFLAPAAPKVQDGAPLDEVFLARDETANMVWAVETQVPLLTGAAVRGDQAARETASYHQRLVGAVAAPKPFAAAVYYQAMSSVPEHWVPFLPVQVSGSNRQIQLQRGGMLRLIDGDPLPAAKIEPATPTLRRGLDASPPAPYFVNEEEVPRAGAVVTRGFQRTRWHNGRTFVWLGLRKETGRGENASRLSFDSLVPSPA